MRGAWLVLALPLTAHADLYRWIDPASGSVKFSSQPPSDPRIEPEVVRYKAPPPPPKPAAAPLPSNKPDLEARWRLLATELAAIPPQELQTGSDRVRQQVQALEAARVELDRADPGGVPRRNAELLAILQRKTP
jgi:hypothetical protein